MSEEELRREVFLVRLHAKQLGFRPVGLRVLLKRLGVEGEIK